MSMYDVRDFDVFFLSYDEPNAEKNWADLTDKAPWAQRVHGVKGFDAAHRTCAEQSTTPWFVTVDADNVVDPRFFDQTLALDPDKAPRQCLSWNGLNMINGLRYGNGGLKLWSKEFVLTMNTHENADHESKSVDFCWEKDYKQLPACYSQVWNNTTPYQAFRVGFREGVKLTLDRGRRIEGSVMRDQLHPRNLRNIRVWSSVGADVQNGMWAILGARWGWRLMLDPTWDHTVVRDYDWFNDFWSKVMSEGHGDDYCENISHAWGKIITQHTGVELPLLSGRDSRFFRDILQHENV